MHENTELSDTPQARLSLWSILGITLSTVLLLGLLLAFLNGFNSNVATSSGRQVNASMPLVGPYFTLSELQAAWKEVPQTEPAEENALLYQPELNISLRDAMAPGTLFIYFLNDKNQRIGALYPLRFDPSGLTQDQDSTVAIKGNSARITLPDGYRNADEFLLHRIDNILPLWKVEIYYKMKHEDRNTLLGTYTVAPPL